jgi:predicted nucleic acid-binding protein
MAEPTHPHYRAALDATDALGLQGDSLWVVPQVLYEFWAVATRPVAANGLGLSAARAQAELVRLKALFPLLHDTPAIYPEWETLVVRHTITGKNSHDARLVAAMGVHGITHLLTFNTVDFAHYQGITTLDPLGVAPPAPPTP